jgi:trans-2,3-dihydro-3-hydroxyanthranilate isomerase
MLSAFKKSAQRKGGSSVKGLFFYIVDVFAEEKFTGNQLAVFRGGANLSVDQMQALAREMHFSETTFIVSEEKHNEGYDVRIFTPAAEVPFAGHPTLGTAHIIRSEIATDAPEEVVLNLKVGQIPVTFNNDISWMKQVNPEFGGNIDVEAVAEVLGLRRSEIDERFPVQQVSTGLPHIIVPLQKLDSLKRARVLLDKYYDLIKNTWAKPILIFCPESHTGANDISVRMFADYYGVPEDPATGSGNGCLAAYLVKNRYWGKNKINIRSEQGYEIRRPSLLYLKAQDIGSAIDVFVGGKSITVARGEMFI